MNIVSFLEAIGNKHLEIFLYILKNIDPVTNLFTGTYDDIEEATRISHQTIVKTMDELQACKFIIKDKDDTWYIDPNVMIKGTDNKGHTYYEFRI